MSPVRPTSIPSRRPSPSKTHRRRTPGFQPFLLCSFKAHQPQKPSIDALQTAVNLTRQQQVGLVTQPDPLEDGLVSPMDEGTPQVGPLSPLLSNLVLDDLDKELERRGHRFCRYADDANIYVRSRRAGERVMASVSRFLTNKLRLKVNEAKSAVARPEERKFLGSASRMTGAKGTSPPTPMRR
jgi:Reverse transcriptase (RNA-dependent DNA polymerase)